jgi:hypothetical protein
MGWEKRRGKLYYYKKERDGDTVKSIYVGKNYCPDYLEQVVILNRVMRQKWKFEDQFFAAECREYLRDYRKLAKNRVVKRNPELLEHVKRWIFILKVCINPNKYLDELYYLLIPESTTKNKLKELAKLKVA